MYALGALLELLLGWDFNVSICVSAVIVLAYIFLGGLTRAIYNEVLQFFLIVLGFAPLVYLGLRDVGGWDGLQARASAARRSTPLAGPASWRTPRRATRWASSGSAWSWGSGFVLSFGYWCTDFLVVQRAMAADSMSAARRTPLIAAVPEDVLPVPGDPAGHDRASRSRYDADGTAASRCRAKRRRPTTTTWRCRRCWRTTSRRACSASG